jgi:hypothetical protein
VLATRHAGPNRDLAVYAGLFQAVLLIHKSPYSSSDVNSYLMELLAYDQSYTLVSKMPVTVCAS